ncbi:MAG: precorrin-6A reductase [Methanobacterium sp.]|nr:precorrin-6A reductase [Methanobacterium sp.]
MNIMVMAGTSDARKIIKELSYTDNYILATTISINGGELAKNSGADRVLVGRFDPMKLAEIIKNYEIDVLIDATHPFASEATKNAIKASETEKINYIRFDRPTLNIPENKLIHKVNNFEEAVDEIIKLGDRRILHLAGVMTLSYLTQRIYPQRIIARVLPTDFSIKKCIEAGLPPENIIAMQGTYSKEFNQAIMKEFNISIIVTKESGISGGTTTKLEAALELGIHIVMVMRPELKELKDKTVFNNLDDVVQEIKRIE